MPNFNLSSSEAWRLFDDAGCPDWVRDHVDKVRIVAIRMAKLAAANGHAVNVDLVEVGAILHDVGRAQTQDPTHAYIGAAWLRQNGVEEPIVNIVERHTGAGLAGADAKLLGLPNRDFIPQTIEEKIVAHADNLVSGPKAVTMEFLERKYAAQGLNHSFSRIQLLHDELGAIIGCNPESLTSEL